MSWIDWTLLAVLGVSALLGFWRGLVFEVLSLAGWVVAFLAAQMFAQTVGGLLPLDGLAAPLPTAAGFVLVFVGVAFVCGLVAWAVKRLIASVGLRPVDRVLGGAFGVARGAVILLAVALVAALSPLRTDSRWQASPVAGVLTQALEALKPLIPASLSAHLS